MKHVSFNGIAQLTADRCNLLLPVRTAYERQLVLEHIVHLVHLKREVRVVMEGRVWLVAAGQAGSCARCERPLGHVEARESAHAAPLCSDCAFSGSGAMPLHRKVIRRAAAYRSSAHRQRSQPVPA